MTDNYLKEELYREIKASDEILEFLQSGSLDGIWYWDLEEADQEWMSPRFWEVFGYEPSEKKDMIHPADLKLALENFKKHCANPDHPYDQIVRYRHRDGSTVWVRCRGLAIRDDTGKALRMLGAHTNVTDQMRAIEYAESIVNAVKHPLLVLFANQRIHSANRSFYQVFQTSPEETEGKLLYDLGNRQWDNPRIREILAAALGKDTKLAASQLSTTFKVLVSGRCCSTPGKYTAPETTRHRCCCPSRTSPSSSGQRSDCRKPSWPPKVPTWPSHSFWRT